MLFAGVQSSDQSFASTGIATAALLGWPHARRREQPHLCSGRQERPFFGASWKADCCMRSRFNARRC